MKKIALFGGSFNPVHRAHIALALAAWEQLQLDQVQLLPAGQPWQKKPLAVSVEDRLAMLQLAIRPYPQLCINPIEIHRTGVTYTIETLEALPRADYYWLMGSDQLQNFCTWHRWQEILQYVHIVVAPRPDYSLELPSALATELGSRPIHILEFTAMAISSTEIRQKLAQHQSLTGILDPAVYDYINTHGLYLN